MPSRLRNRLPWGTLRARLAIWNTLVVLAMVVAALLAARLAARATLYDAADAELRSGVQEIVLALRDLFPDMDAVVAEMRRKAASHEQRGWFTQLLSEDGTQIWTSEHCPDEVANYPPHNLDRAENVVQVGPYRYVRLRIAQAGQPVFHVRIGFYTTGLDASLAGLMRVLTGIGILLCGLTPLAGWWLAARSTRPVADILATADRLDPSRLGDRLPVRGTDDELDHLARTVNRLLDDVAAHVSRQGDFLADAAHELRGPLAAMRGAIEVALSHDRSAAEYRESLAVVLDEARYLSRVANGVLLLAEADADVAATPMDVVDVAGLARQAVAMFEGVGEEKNVDVRISASSTGTEVSANADQVRQVIVNLLDNAIRFTPPGGVVEVGVTRRPGDDDVAITVSDTGTGIGAEHIPRLFDRFFKVDPARSHDGTMRSGGLGLPICKAIVERHGGTISVASRAGQGTTVTARLPAFPGQPSPPSTAAAGSAADRISVAIGNS